MSIVSIWTGVETPDTATLSTGGVTFVCFSWKNRQLEQIEARVMVELPDGEFTEVSSVVIAKAVEDIVDCPRVLAIGDIFVVHWVDTELLAGTPVASDLFRATFDCTTPVSGWNNLGSVAIHITNQYDHDIIYNSNPEEFVVVRRVNATDIASTRYTSPFGWIDTVWSTNDGPLTIADTVLGCCANEDEDTVMWAWQDTLLMRAQRRNASDGLNLQGPNEVFADLTAAGDNQFTAVSMTHISGDNYIIAVEFVDDVNHSAGGYRAYARGVGWRALDGTIAFPLHESQWVYGVQMASKIWTWSSGGTNLNDVYLALAFQSLTDSQEFQQSYMYVARLFWRELSAANAAGVMRPVVCAAMTGGDLDARPHGESPFFTSNVSIGGRMNHLPAPAGPGRNSPAATEGPALGPNGKTMTFAVLRWSRLVATYDGTDTDLQPLQGAVGFVRFFHEDPWMIRRDPLEATQPDLPQWEGSASRIMSRPVNVPTGLILTGGVTVAYDGLQPVELGYFWAPEIVEVAVVIGGGAMDFAGDYYFTVTYSWTDGSGQLHRSPPATPVRVTMAIGDFANVYVRPISLTQKDNTRRYPFAGAISMELWRTYVVGGSADIVNNHYLFRREYSGNTVGDQLRDTPANDPSDFRQLILGGRANFALQLGELAPYQLNLTTLQWSPPAPIPHVPLTAATTWRNRVIGVDPREPRELIYSEEILPLGAQYVLPEFLDSNRVRFDGRGEITAIQAMDYTIVVFTRDEIYTVEGTPASGGSASSLDIRNVVTGVGCVSADSVIHTSDGVFFQSANGIHMIDRGFNVKYIGSPVEELVERAGNIRGGAHNQADHQVKWVLNEEPGTGPLEVRPRVLTYDYSVGLWSVDVMVGFAQTLTASRLNEMQGAAVWRGRDAGQQMVVLQQGGLALERSKDDAVYSDEGAAGTVSIVASVRTEWLRLDGVAGLWRVRELGVQTERRNDGGMAVDVYYDRDGSYDETAPTDTPTWASPAPAYLTIKPSVQRLSAVMLEIRELTPPATENVRIVSLMVRWTQKPTPRRVGASTIGT